VRPSTAACEEATSARWATTATGSGTSCVTGAPAVCEGACLTARAAPATGCVLRPSTDACDDASLCTIGDHCSGCRWDVRRRHGAVRGRRGVHGGRV
jgi:hypothetical protein